MDFKGKRVLIVGTGKSGTGAYRLLSDLSAECILFDGNEKADPDIIRSRIGEEENVEIYTGDIPDEVLDDLNLVILSPGVPTDIPIVQDFYARQIPVWGEVELAYRAGRGDVLAITGTNGKTTTTALLGHIMSDFRDSVFVVGNIGTAYTSRSLEMTDDTVTVAEISSFQLETIDRFAPKVSAILNITEDHLNRHHTMEEYIRVKEEIAKNQSKDDWCILNYEDDELRGFAERIEPRVLFFSSVRVLPEGTFGAYMIDDRIIFRLPDEKTPSGKKELELVKTDELRLLGAHNYENVMAASLMAWAYGVSIENIRSSVRTFTAVEHRIEFVTEKNGVAWYNDSKGTNPDAAIKAIQAMNRPTVLIGGGFDKGSDYDEWIRSFDGKVKYLVLIGQTREKIRDAAFRLGFTDIVLANNLEEAVQVCSRLASPGDACLLSPACASWGQFENYEQRGNMFKDYVRAL